YQLEDTHRQGYLDTAHMQPRVDPMPAAEAAKLRSEMARAVPAGIRLFAGIDFTGADLSGLDLREVNFEGAWLEGADLRNANLSGANLCSAVL
ncbi:pentapeptide repeat-containing protein, partial [Pseudoxanthomonas sp. KAs_5_3]|uniref:pentapeptide repeat-containing protein n=2 Tax=Pseudomonadota TaxID=1224 RepID=UPI000D4F7684